ncbi:hypothetical protein [uncultured Arenimonas sp.]|uniref:hypothetical protein n=1 Tax=uncultured Arenimonas sp. TaxID=546226 RepID=UPI0030DD38B1
MSLPSPSATALALRALRGALAAYSYRYGSEVQLHDRLGEVLTAAGVSYQREFVLDAKNRADFWIDGVVLEVKVDGSLPEALRQIGRYIGLDQVNGVLLASTKPWARTPLRVKPRFDGKPFDMVYLRRQSL